MLYLAVNNRSIGDTYMDSMLFNVGIILIASLAVAQYCTISFSEYASGTASQAIFRVQAQNLQGLRQGYMGVVVLFPVVAVITLGVVAVSFALRVRQNRMKAKRAGSTA
jgi:LMBR1 domain-containing protein 1